MPDIGDIGKHNMDMADRLAVSAICARIPSGPGLKLCEDCGDDIPAARKKANPGCTRCISCQEAFERQ